MIGASMAVRPPRSRGPVLMMIDALRRLGGNLWMVDNAFSGAFVDNVGTTPVTAVGDLIGKVSDKTGTNHATQSAVASKPSVQRVPKRLGPNLVPQPLNFSAGWAAQGSVAPSGSSFTTTTGAGMSLLLEANKTYVVETAGSTTGGAQIGVLNPGVTSTMTPNSFGTRTQINTISGQTHLYIRNQSAGTTTLTGFTVQEVLEWANVISFDGSNDFLQTGITTGNEGWVCAGVTPSSITSYRTIAHTGVLGSAKGIWLLSDLGRWVMTTFNNSASHSTAYIDATTSPTVVSGGWNVSTVLLEVNGQSVSAARTGDCVGTTPLRIGITSANSFPLSGPMTAFAYTPVLPDAADRATIRNGIAALQGRTL